MRRIVIDASITLAWLFDEEDSTDRIKPVLDSSELFAPWLWKLEVTNTVLVRQRRKILTAIQASQLLQLIDELTIGLIAEPTTRSATALAQLAQPHQLSAYDAVYLDLAIREDLPLLTQDNNLRIAAKHSGVRLVQLSN